MMLFHPRQHFGDQLPGPLYGTDVQLFGRGMYITHVRSDGYAVQTGDLPGELAALQACVNGFDDHVFSGLVVIDLADQIPQR